MKVWFFFCGEKLIISGHIWNMTSNHFRHRYLYTITLSILVYSLDVRMTLFKLKCVVLEKSMHLVFSAFKTNSGLVIETSNSGMLSKLHIISNWVQIMCCVKVDFNQKQNLVEQLEQFQLTECKRSCGYRLLRQVLNQFLSK